MRTSRLTLLATLSLALAGTLPACVASEPTDEEAGAITSSELEAYIAGLPQDQEIVIIDPTSDDFAAAPPVFHHQLDLQLNAPDSSFGVCACTTQSCLDYWADQQQGCGYCMVFLCDDQPEHVCIACE